MKDSHPRLTTLKALNVARPYLHTARQLRARYKVTLSPEDYLRYCHLIARDLPDLAQESTPIHTRVIVHYRIHDRRVRLVFDAVTHCIITALPRPEYRPTGQDYYIQGTARRKCRGYEGHRHKGSKYRPRWEDFE